MVFHPRDPTTGPSRGGISSGGRSPQVSPSRRLPRSWLRAASDGGSAPGPEREDLVPRFGTEDKPVTLQTYEDNPPIDSNLEPEAGPLVLYNWEQYIWKQVVRDFGKKYGVEVKVETFYNMEQAIQKFQTGEVDVDVFFPTIDYLPKLVAAKMIQPLNHDYIPQLTNVWPELQDPYYDKGSLYSVPYTIYTTGIAWRTDIVPVEPEELAASSNPYEIFWDADYAGKVGIYDAYREALSLGMYRDLLNETDLNSSDPAVINAAKDRLIELIDLVDVKTTIDGAYSGIPEGSSASTRRGRATSRRGPSTRRTPRRTPPCSATTGPRAMASAERSTTTCTRSPRTPRTRCSRTCSSTT